MVAANERSSGSSSHCSRGHKSGNAFARDAGKEAHPTRRIPWFVTGEYKRTIQPWIVLVVELTAQERLQERPVGRRHFPYQRKSFVAQINE